MMFGRKKAYRTRAYELMRILGVSANELPILSPIHAQIEQCRGLGMNEYEAAAVMTLSNLGVATQRGGPGTAASIFEQISAQAERWIEVGYIARGEFNEWKEACMDQMPELRS